jgi:hypothetical protein
MDFYDAKLQRSPVLRLWMQSSGGWAVDSSYLGVWLSAWWGEPRRTVKRKTLMMSAARTINRLSQTRGELEVVLKEALGNKEHVWKAVQILSYRKHLELVVPLRRDKLSVYFFHDPLPKLGSDEFP